MKTTMNLLGSLRNIGDEVVLSGDIPQNLGVVAMSVKKLKFLDIFAGIGGFRLGLERAGHECVGHVEIDKFARKSYEAMHNTGEEWTHDDITTITNEQWRELRGTVDIIAGGFPCQAFSIAGKRGGFEDTRGTLFFDIARAAKEIEPSYLFLENVKGLFSHDKGRTFGTIIQTLDELGFITEWGLFNSKFWGVPQNRERVFIVATRKDKWKKPILFDLLKQQELNGVNVKLRDVLETEVDEKFYLSKEQTDRLVFNMGDREKSEDEIKILAHHKNFRRNTQVFDQDGVTETLDTGQGGGRGHYTMEEPRAIKDKILMRETDDGFHLCRNDEKKSSIQGTHVTYPDGTSHCLSAAHKPMTIDPGRPIREATKQGYSVAKDGETNQGVVEVAIGASRGRNPENPSDRTPGNYVEQRLEINREGTSNTLSTVQKDNYVVEKEYSAVALQNSNMKGRRIKEIDEPSFTVSAHDRHAVLEHPDIRIRKLTPKECWRLQGFPDWAFDRAKAAGISDSQLYKQAGNAVTVPVVQHIAELFTSQTMTEDHS